MGKPIKILYICTPSSIHDQKWIKFFALKKDYEVFALGESKYENDLENEMRKHNIQLLPRLNSFSVTHPIETIKSIIKLNKYIQDNQIDLVHVLFATPYALWTNFIRIPFFITTRGSDVLKVLPELQNKSGIKGLYFRWLFKQFKKSFSNARQIISTSQQQVKFLQSKIVNKRIELIRTGVDVEKIATIEVEKYLPKELTGKNIIFSPRFFSPIYNIDFLIDAIWELPEKLIYDNHFVFIKGKQFDTNYSENILNRLENLQREKKFQYTVFDYLTQEEIWSIYHKSSLTIMVPLSDGTPNSALEAMAAGSKLILSDLPYDQELFNDLTCTKVSLDNKNQLKNEILKSLSNELFLEKNAFIKVKEFGNRTIEMEKLNKLYHDNLILEIV